MDGLIFPAGSSPSLVARKDGLVTSCVKPTNTRKLMHLIITQKTPEIAAICRRYGVRRLDIFGSAARGTDFDPDRSDADFLVEFENDKGTASPLQRYLGLEQDLAQLFERSVDLVERHALENSRNYIRRRSILRDLESVYG